MTSLHHTSLIFGGSGHLGVALCKTLNRELPHQERRQIIATYCHDDTNNKFAELQEAGILTVHCDICQNDSVVHATAEINKLSARINSMVYAIGSLDDLTRASEQGREFYSLDNLSQNQIQASLALHTQGAIRACQTAVPMLREAGGGNIVLMGALNGLKLVPSPVHFAAAKSALLGITQALAKELGQDNIRINLVVPGMIDSPALDRLPQRQKDLYLKHSAQRRFIDVQEVAEVVSWFALENTYVTGQAIILDGGL